MSDQQTTDYAESWKPEQPGEKVQGRVIEVKMGPDMGYGPYPIVVLSTADGERAVHAFHQVLRTELARRRPRPGDNLEITYLGLRKPKSGNGQGFHLYRVQGGQEPEFNWDAELQAAGEQSQAPVSQAPPIPPAPASQPAPIPQPVAAADDDLPF